MVNRDNFLQVREHLQYLGDVYQLSPASLGRYKFYLRHLLLWAGETPLSRSHTLRPAFPTSVGSLPGKDGQPTLAAVSQKKIVQAAKRFYQWAKTAYPKEYSRLPAGWVDALRPPRIIRGAREHVFVTLDEVLTLLSLPVDDEDPATLRDQAAAAMLFLSGMRASAFTTLPIAAVDLQARTIRQWPELGVHTKNSKRATTYLLPIPELFEFVEKWDSVVRNTLAAEATWYAPIDSQWGVQTLSTKKPGENRSLALNKRLRLLWERAGLTYKSAHKFRHGHAVYGLQHAKTMADYKAVSMNLMHGDLKITDQIYAPLLSSEVESRIANLGSKPAGKPDDGLSHMVGDLSNADLARIAMLIAQRLAE